MIELDNLKNFIIAFAIVVLFAGALAIGMNDFRDTIVDDMNGITGYNESASITAGTPTVLGNSFIKSITDIWNSSDYRLNTTHYKVISAGTEGAQINITNTSYGQTSSWKVTYVYGERDTQYNITTKGLVGVDNSMSYGDTIGTLMGVAILISIVVVSFAVWKR